MKKYGLFVTFISFLISAAFFIAFPCNGCNFGNPGFAVDHDGILSKLDLTEEQMNKIRSLRESFYKDTTPLRTQIFEKRAELRLLWMQTELDVEKIKAKEKEIHDLIWQVFKKTTDFRLKFRSLLTSEQLSKFLALGGDWRHSHGKDWRHYHGPDRGPGKSPDIDW
jgi:Spy/CpxP family protein refolding chaperone